MAMSSEYQAGELRGRHAGWDDTSFADAYGDKTTAKKSFKARGHYGDSGPDYRSGWFTGYAQGVENFENDLDVDGTPRD